MNVLYIAHYSALYGANIALLNNILEMRKNYVLNPIVLIKEEGTFSEELKKKNILYIIHDFYGWMTDCNRKTTWRDYRSILRNYEYSKRICEECKSYKIDLVHSNSSVAYIGCFIAKSLGVPHIWQIGEFGKEDYNLDYLFSSSFVKNKYFSADAIINVSKALHDKFHTLYPTMDIRVIYNGIPGTSMIKEEYNHLNKLEFCCTGLLSTGKNQIELLQAAEMLLEDGIQNFNINLIGDSEADYKQSLVEYVKEHRLDNCVKFWGYQSDVRSILEKMDVGVMCSKSEAFGLVTVEYMQASMPVIGVAQGGTKEIVVNGVTGDWYESGDVVKLKELMKQYCTRRELLKQRGKAGFRRYEECFTMEKQAKQVYELYLEVLKR